MARNENGLTLKGTDLPLDLDHVPADYAEAVEMLRRAKARIEALEIDNAALEDLLSGDGP